MPKIGVSYVGECSIPDLTTHIEQGFQIGVKQLDEELKVLNRFFIVLTINDCIFVRRPSLVQGGPTYR